MTYQFDTKLFVIDYFVIGPERKREIKQHYTYSHSRKGAENNTRTMEQPSKINIIKIIPIIFDEASDKLLSDAIMAHISKNGDERDSDVRYCHDEIC